MPRKKPRQPAGVKFALDIPFHRTRASADARQMRRARLSLEACVPSMFNS
jgi:hypothetical protein